MSQATASATPALKQPPGMSKSPTTYEQQDLWIIVALLDSFAQLIDH